MNELTRIYKDHNVRIIEKDGQPWFGAFLVVQFSHSEHEKEFEKWFFSKAVNLYREN